MRWVLVVAVSLASCRCDSGLSEVSPESIVVEPSEIDFGGVYVGANPSRTIAISNIGGATAVLDAATTEPFSTASESLRLSRGATEQLVVTFTPTSAGAFNGTLKIGPKQIELHGEGLAPLECVPEVCVTSSFDPHNGVCIATPRSNGTACETKCVIGTCDNASCVGQSVNCDDGDRCTDDACSEVKGCTHTPTRCGSPSACEAGTCDPQLGCVVVQADDGVLCGADDCIADTVSICIAGQCVERARPDTARCSNRWKPLQIPARYYSAMSWDPLRAESILFGGTTSTGQFLRDTWSWDGSRWVELFPANAPTERVSARMATDVFRRRIVLFGGFTVDARGSAETWEWDGANWLLRTPSQSPPARGTHAMAFDSKRRRVVLFGGGPLRDTWEWDGVTWSRRMTTNTPPAMSDPHMAWDEARQRVLLVSSAHTETWAFDGIDWARVSSFPPNRSVAALTWNGTLGKVIGVTVEQNDQQSKTWAFDGVTWEQVSPTIGPPHRRSAASTWDPVREHTVLFSGVSNEVVADTWLFDGSRWQLGEVRERPGAGASLLAAGAQGIVALGSYPATTSTMLSWRWNGGAWSSTSTPLAPSQRGSPAVTWDESRRVIVLFGGPASPNTLDDTWEHDGVSWTQRVSTHRPPAGFRPALGFDPLRRRAVLLVEDPSSQQMQTWEWDGLDWAEKISPVVPPRGRVIAWNDADQQLQMFGGGIMWAWDGSSWSALSGALPAETTAFDFPGMAFDRRRRVMLVLTDDQTWEWANGTWTRRTPVVPLARWSQLAWDDASQRVFANESGTMWVFLP